MPDKLNMMSQPMKQFRQNLMEWLKQGVSPRRLALTIALGFAIGCIPILGVTTALCVLVATLLRLNLPAIQAANWMAMPLQMVLLAPFVKLGGKLPVIGTPNQGFDVRQLLHSSPMSFVEQMGSLAGQALAAWTLVAIPAVLLITGVLTLVFRRIPAISDSNCQISA